MVVLSSGPDRVEKSIAAGIPTIDLTYQPSRLPGLILNSCEEHGFFKLINHGIQTKTVSKLEKECIEFFSKPPGLKHHAAASPDSPFGYGCRNIGPNGDVGELEYLLLHSDPFRVDERFNCISDEPTKFRYLVDHNLYYEVHIYNITKEYNTYIHYKNALFFSSSDSVNEYTHAVRELASQILDLLCEGLQLSDRHAFSKLIRDVASDSLLRINQYSPATTHSTIGFGEHSDPQILAVLRSNDVEGLQFQLYNGLWVTVPPDPDAFYVIVGDALQVNYHLPSNLYTN